MIKWSKWRKFPDPRRAEYLIAPFGPGVYELRNRKTGEKCFSDGAGILHVECRLYYQNHLARAQEIIRKKEIMFGQTLQMLIIAPMRVQISRK